MLARERVQAIQERVLDLLIVGLDGARDEMAKLG